jgi:hypothetical protein
VPSPSPLDHPELSQRYFFPRRGAPRELCWIDAAPERLSCAYRPAAPGAYTVVFFHGNGEICADYLPDFADHLSALGLGSLFVEYRGYGESSGTPSLAAMLPDGECALRALSLDPTRVISFGRSIGSLYALELVRRVPEIPALVLESGIADLLERILLRVTPEMLGVSRQKLSYEVAHLFDQRHKLAAYTGKTLVLHAAHDDLVDPIHARRNASWAGGEATLRLFPKGDHNSIFYENQREYLQALSELLGTLSHD